MSSLYTLGEAQRRAEIELTVGDARKAIAEALGYIERQEDGPLTMRHALKDIGNTITSLENELFELHYTIETLDRLATRLRDQRDEAMLQRDILTALSVGKDTGDAAGKNAQ